MSTGSTPSTRITKQVVSLFESYGAGASYVGPKVAEILGLPYVGQGHSTAELEAADPKGSGRVNLTNFYAALAWTDTVTTDLIEDPMRARAKEQAALVYDLMKDGGVILGRNGTVILSQVPGSVHVKLDGPTDYRVQRACEVAGISRDQANLRRRREDTARAEMSLALWGWDPRMTDHFDLVINTEKFGLDGAVDMIVAAARASYQAVARAS